MTKNLYYAAVYGRRNHIKEFILNFFLAISSWPRMLLEVFIRRNMGERYFSFGSAILMTIVLAVFPYYLQGLFFTISDYRDGMHYSDSFWDYVGHHLLWYLYLGAFMGFCVQRRSEIKRLPSVFDFKRFSLSGGEIMPFLHYAYPDNKGINIRMVETIIEPLFFFVIGLVLIFMEPMLGRLIVFCSIVYSLSYFAAYAIGNDFIMDKIDERICSEELAAAFIDDKPSSETRGFNVYGRRPADEEGRRKVVDDCFGDEDDFAEVR